MNRSLFPLRTGKPVVQRELPLIWSAPLFQGAQSSRLLVSTFAPWSTTSTGTPTSGASRVTPVRALVATTILLPSTAYLIRGCCAAYAERSVAPAARSSLNEFSAAPTRTGAIDREVAIVCLIRVGSAPFHHTTTCLS